ncbi:response regulator [Frankia sp. CcI49]|uniref:response regulator n=1 Tax=Frankia sp. CcI49 TaxID=1745382 RepID=UPI000A01822F|nr:response regulator [Frankia sp. CcI49]
MNDSTGGGGPGVSPCRRLLLLVDDDAADATLLGEALRERGLDIDVHLAADGDQVSRYLCDAAEPKPDLILLDPFVPRMDVIPLLHFLRIDRDLRRVPLIVLADDGATRNIPGLAGAPGVHVAKPVDYEAFIGLVQKIEKSLRDPSPG